MSSNGTLFIIKITFFFTIKDFCAMERTLHFFMEPLMSKPFLRDVFV